MNRLAIVTSQAFSLVNFRGPLIRDLVAAGVEVYAFAPDYDETVRARVTALGAIPVEYSLIRARMSPIRDVWDMLKLACAIRRLRPDATLAYFIKPVIYGSIAAWLAKVPNRYSLIEGLGYVFMDNTQAKTLMRRILRGLVSTLYRVALATNKRIMLLNNDDIGDLVNSGILRADKAFLITGIGVSLAEFNVAPCVADSLTFVLVARMLEDKGILDFVAAARMVLSKAPQTKFILVGGTDANPSAVSRDVLERWVAEGWVEWTEQVDDVRPWVARASVFVLPSYREGLPRSTQEAMAMGKPVITTDVPGCRETVDHGVNGWLVPVRDPQALSQAMMRFIMQPELIAPMGAESRRMAEDRFDVRKINRKILAVLGVESSR